MLYQSDVLQSTISTTRGQSVSVDRAMIRETATSRVAGLVKKKNASATV